MRKREAVFMGIGILAGLALSGPAAQAATSITAKLSRAWRSTPETRPQHLPSP